MPDPIPASLRAIGRTAMAAPMLGAAEELELIEAAQAGHRRSVNRIIEAHLRMPYAMAIRNRRYGLPVEDLYQAGCVGLMVALDRFDPAHGVRFATYARWYVDAEVQDFIMRNVASVRMVKAAVQKALFFGLRRERARLESEMPGAGPAAINDALAKHFGAPLAEVERIAMVLDGGDWSLDAALCEGDGGISFGDLLADDRPDPEAAVMEARDSRKLSRCLRDAVAALPDRDRLIVGRRTLAEEPTTLEGLARDLSLSKERVRQLEMRAIQRVSASLRHEVA